MPQKFRQGVTIASFRSFSTGILFDRLDFEQGQLGRSQFRPEKGSSVPPRYGKKLRTGQTDIRYFRGTRHFESPLASGNHGAKKTTVTAADDGFTVDESCLLRSIDALLKAFSSAPLSPRRSPYRKD